MNKKVTFICDVCKDKSSTQKSENNCRVSAVDSSFVCAKCSKVFSMAFEVTDKKVDCSIQSERIDNSEEYRTQQENETTMSKESQDKSYKCNVCEATYKSFQSLYRHKNIHKGKYKCKACSKCLGSKHDLIIHTQKHSKVIPFKCSICHKAFKFFHSLKNHLNLHNKSNPFKCGLCEKIFFSKHKLKEHMIKHSDERPHQCSMCPKAYKRKHHLLFHLKKHKQDNLQPPRKTDESLE